MTLDPALIFHDLISAGPVRLNELPKEHGIYALHDHGGKIRYIGITQDRAGFYGRICNRHTTGSNGRSHKFSHAYNTGRMWCENKDSREDARTAKALRTAFIRRYCRATFVTIPALLCRDLPSLESAVQALAPKDMLDWGNERNFDPLPEPKELVDALIDEMNCTANEKAAFGRQAALHASIQR